MDWKRILNVALSLLKWGKQEGFYEQDGVPRPKPKARVK